MPLRHRPAWARPPDDLALREFARCFSERQDADKHRAGRLFAYCVRLPLLLLILLSGRLVAFDAPLVVRHRAVKITSLELLTTI